MCLSVVITKERRKAEQKGKSSPFKQIRPTPRGLRRERKKNLQVQPTEQNSIRELHVYACQQVRPASWGLRRGKPPPQVQPTDQNGVWELHIPCMPMAVLPDQQTAPGGFGVRKFPSWRRLKEVSGISIESPNCTVTSRSSPNFSNTKYICKTTGIFLHLCANPITIHTKPTKSTESQSSS